mmetsp:Transcript_20482/g.28600  ORF Transcript_20482/g.28600 Transcript_20482/m.28600 type:complete len:407 (+) Transcript_20482:317-1537(+)|eukprot:CAMPEP_0184496628 /NCGR_PEP_ID=MMETSP0113_2-20130426/34459_1 /TAXON_ID=91329 /ORGANISM="Norrisiella sphaerica, Strain BC52" /LENGTH=406 /DNA_ID=CAMNT_0026883345 /DNA_START=306 /DNA_END=1526 /DNA_ORIENTATION=-
MMVRDISTHQLEHNRNWLTKVINRATRLQGRSKMHSHRLPLVYIGGLLLALSATTALFALRTPHSPRINGEGILSAPISRAAPGMVSSHMNSRMSVNNIPGSLITRASGLSVSPSLGQSAGQDFAGAYVPGRHRYSKQSSRSSLRPVRVNAIAENAFSRFGRILRSYANAFMEMFEDPEKIIDQAVEDMQTDLSKMRSASARALAGRKQLENQYLSAKSTADRWQQNAELALRRGDEGLAREALMRKKSFQKVADGLHVQLTAQAKAMDNLLGNVQLLEKKLAEARSKKDTLKARAASARTTKQISEMISGIDTTSALAAFEKMEQKVTALEAETEANIVLAGGDSLDRAFNSLEYADDLAELKRNIRMTGTSPGPSVISSRHQVPKQSARKFDFELEELRSELHA